MDSVLRDEFVETAILVLRDDPLCTTAQVGVISAVGIQDHQFGIGRQGAQGVYGGQNRSGERFWMDAQVQQHDQNGSNGRNHSPTWAVGVARISLVHKKDDQ